MPELSVCITHYNRPRGLRASLESLTKQTRPPDEVLVWDDCSPEDPGKIVSEFTPHFKCLRYHRNLRNLGMPGNLNAVIREARGELIANLHDADVYHAQLLECWERALVEHETAGLVFCGLDAKTQCPGKGRIWIHDYSELTPGRTFFERAYVGQTSSPIWGTVMARRAVYQRHLPFDARFGPWADVDMWMRVCGTHDIAYVARPLIVINSDSHFRAEFRWDTLELLLSMHLMNIHRMAQSPEQRQRWLARQRLHAAKTIARIFAGRVAKLEFMQMCRCLQKCPQWLTLIRGH
jgi:glycosyltransferase involved in cell wall biosynthesis